MNEYKEEINNLFLKIWNLLEEKQKNYGNTYDIVPEILKLFLIEKKDQHGNFILTEKDIIHLLSITRILDKLFRIINGNNGDEDAWEDILGYCILEKIKIIKEKK